MDWHIEMQRKVCAVQSRVMSCPKSCTSLPPDILTIYELEIRHRSQHIVFESWESDGSRLKVQGNSGIFQEVSNPHQPSED